MRPAVTSAPTPILQRGGLPEACPPPHRVTRSQRSPAERVRVVGAIEGSDTLPE